MNLENLAHHILRIFLPFFFSTAFVQPRTVKQNPDHYTGSSHYDNNSFLFRCHGTGKQTIRFEFIVFQSRMVNMQYRDYLPWLTFKRGHHSCHPGRGEDIMNCLRARDVLSVNENYCLILKDNNLRYSVPK